MTLPLQGVEDEATDQNFRQVGERFPIQAEDLGKSARQLFVQLATPGARKINFGTATVKWAGSKSETEVKEVAHGLGSAAVIALGGAQTTNTFFVTAEPSGTDKIKLQGYAPGSTPPAGTERTVYWIAMG